MKSIQTSLARRSRREAKLNFLSAGYKITKERLTKPHRSFAVKLTAKCFCRSKAYSHEPEVHKVGLWAEKVRSVGSTCVAKELSVVDNATSTYVLPTAM